MKYTCPVCGYDEMEEPPESFSICSSCGTEFGSDDFVLDQHDYERKLAELRAEWLAAGAPWFDEDTPPPANWNPLKQALRVGLGLVVSPAYSVTSSEKTTDVGAPRFVFGFANA